MKNSELYKRLYNLEVSDLEYLKELADDIIVDKMLNQMINEQSSLNEEKL